MLHRSVTEMRRLRRGRPKRSRMCWQVGGPATVGESWRDGGTARRVHPDLRPVAPDLLLPHGQAPLHFLDHVATGLECLRPVRRGGEDRKSTRLNSSHVRISYAVFCLKKKKKKVGMCRP